MKSHSSTLRSQRGSEMSQATVRPQAQPQRPSAPRDDVKTAKTAPNPSPGVWVFLPWLVPTPSKIPWSLIPLLEDPGLCTGWPFPQPASLLLAADGDPQRPHPHTDSICPHRSCRLGGVMLWGERVPSPPCKAPQVTQSGPSRATRYGPPERHSGHKSL